MVAYRLARPGGGAMMKNDINLEDILTDHASEEDFLEVPVSDRAFKNLALLGVILSAVLIWQVFNLNVLQGSFYDRRAFANMSDPNVQTAPRGIIFDRYNAPLVQNAPAFNVFLDPRSLPTDTGSRLQVIGEAAQILGLDENTILQNLSGKDWNVSDRLLLKSDVSHDELVALSAANLPGVDVESGFKREPVVPWDFSHILGYVGLASEADLRANPDLTSADLVGRAGLEAEYDQYLRGTDGERIVLSNAAGQAQSERTLRLPEPGDNVTTYIDAPLQEFFYQSLTADLKKLGKTVAVGIAMNPQNGQVLALVDIPPYDPNNIAAAIKDPNQPLFNRAIAGLYNPASTIKPLDAIAALVSGILDPTHKIFSPGYLDVPNPYDPSHPTRFLDWQYQGWVDLYSALAKSSDVYFYEVGGGFGNQQGLGITRLHQWWENFLLDKPTGIDLPGEKSGFLPTPEWLQNTLHTTWTLGQTFNVSIGQGNLLITPIELLDYISAIGNGGKIYQPEIMQNITTPQGQVLVQNQPKVRADLAQEFPTFSKWLPDVQKGMIDGVQKPYGTSYMLHDLPISAAAKTGSAQVKDNKETNAFFVGYAPAENPQIALLVLVENAVDGTLNAVPVANQVLAWYYKNRMASSTAAAAAATIPAL